MVSSVVATTSAIPEGIRLEYPRVLEVEIDGVILAFRPLRPSEADALVAQLERIRGSGGPMELNLGTVRRVCVHGQEHFDALVEQYPLTFSEDILEELLKMARAHARMTIQGARAKWMQGSRNLGHTAEALLAFKAYEGGDFSDEQFAGALHLAELIDTQKATFKLLMAFFKSLSKRH
jgi:hypothetical protein